MEMDIKPVDTDNVRSVWDMFLALCKEQGTDHYISATAETFRKAMCEPDSILKGLVVEHDGKAVGTVLYFFGASPYSAAPFLLFKGLYIAPQFRKQGIAKLLMQELVKIARAKNCAAIQWNVIKENAGALSYYKHLGFTPDPDPLLDYMESLEDFSDKLD